MFILDTSIYVSAFLEDDTNHELGLNILSNLNWKINIPYLVFQEVITVLTYKHSKKLAWDFVDFILEDNRFILINWEIIEEISFWQDIKNKISYIDIIVIYTAIKYSIKLYAFDKDMEKLYKKYLK